MQQFQCSGLTPVSLARAAEIRTLRNRRAELPFRNKALKTRTKLAQSTALERKGPKERIWGEMPERRSTAFGLKARRTWGFQARATWRETVANKRMAEGRELGSIRLREAVSIAAKPRVTPEVILPLFVHISIS